MSSMVVTSVVAGTFAVMLVPHSMQISLLRVKTTAVFGDAGDEALRRRIRAHGNFIEYAPLAVIWRLAFGWSLQYSSRGRSRCLRRNQD